MRTEWIDNQIFVKYSGQWILKVRKQFSNGFERYNWVPEVWLGDSLVIDGNGHHVETSAEAMSQAERLLAKFLDSSIQSLVPPITLGP